MAKNTAKHVGIPNLAESMNKVSGINNSIAIFYNLFILVYVSDTF